MKNSKPSFKTIKQTVTLPASPEKVYGAYVDLRQHAAFTGTAATGKVTRGGTMTAHGGYITAKTTALLPTRKIVQQWQTSEWPEGYPPSRLELTFKKIKTGTQLTMVHSRVPSQQAGGYRTGWRDYYWKPLRDYLAKRRAQ